MKRHFEFYSHPSIFAIIALGFTFIGFAFSGQEMVPKPHRKDRKLSADNV